MNNFGTLVNFELKKILSRRIVRVLFIIMLVLTALLLNDGMFDVDVEEDGLSAQTEILAPNRDTMKEFEGMLWNAENYDDIIALYKDRKSNHSNNIYGSGPLEWYDSMLNITDNPTYADFEIYRQDYIGSDIREQKLTDKEIKHWKIDEIVEKPIILGHSIAYVETGNTLHMIMMLFVFMVSFALCATFSSEHTLKTDALTLCTQNGRMKLFLARFIAGEIFSFVSGLTLCTFSFGLCVALYGAGGFNLPVQTWKISSLYSLTMGEFMLICFGLLLVSGLLTGAMAMLLSELTHSAIPSLAVSFAILLISIIEPFRNAPRIFQQVKSYLPILRVGQMSLNDNRLVFGMNALQFSYILYGILTLIFAVLCWQCYKRYQVQGR